MCISTPVPGTCKSVDLKVCQCSLVFNSPIRCGWSV